MFYNVIVYVFFESIKYRVCNFSEVLIVDLLLINIVVGIYDDDIIFII